MPKYSVDPDGVEHVATTLRLAAGYAPSDTLVDAAGCGSLAVEAAVATANDELESAWQASYEALDSRSSGAIEAALRYRENENRVYSGATRRRR